MIDERLVDAEGVVTHLDEFCEDLAFDFLVVGDIFERRLGLFNDTER